MRFISAGTAALTVLALAALPAFCPCPASAATLQYTLSGVTFADGATAGGFFNYNTTTNTVGGYSITTTNGVGDGVTGVTYTPATATYGDPPISFGATGTIGIAFYGGPGGGNSGVLDLVTATATPTAGIIPLTPGGLDVYGYETGSNETVTPSGGPSVDRNITAGDLVVTPAAVPEASSMISLGLMLAAAGALLLFARRRTASCAV